MSAELMFDMLPEEAEIRVAEIREIAKYDPSEADWLLYNLYTDVIDAIANGTDDPVSLAMAVRVLHAGQESENPEQ